MQETNKNFSRILGFKLNYLKNLCSKLYYVNFHEEHAKLEIKTYLWLHKQILMLFMHSNSMLFHYLKHV